MARTKRPKDSPAALVAAACYRLLVEELNQNETLYEMMAAAIEKFNPNDGRDTDRTVEVRDAIVEWLEGQIGQLDSDREA